MGSTSDVKKVTISRNSAFTRSCKKLPSQVSAMVEETVDHLVAHLSAGVSLADMRMRVLHFPEGTPDSGYRYRCYSLPVHGTRDFRILLTIDRDVLFDRTVVGLQAIVTHDSIQRTVTGLVRRASLDLGLGKDGTR
jgi:hypothetical protein